MVYRGNAAPREILGTIRLSGTCHWFWSSFGNLSAFRAPRRRRRASESLWTVLSLWERIRSGWLWSSGEIFNFLFLFMSSGA